MKPQIKIGSKVVFKYNGEREERIFGFVEKQEAGKVITPHSPIGKAVRDKLPGDKFNVITPGGNVNIEILEVL